MPELPEVETVVRGITPLIEGKTILACRHVSKEMFGEGAEEFPARMAGNQFESTQRVGKWIYLHLRHEDTLIIHLGMTGHLSVEESKSPLEPHTHLRLALETGKKELRFVDPRRFGELKLFSRTQMIDWMESGHLGPDALSASRDYFDDCFFLSKRNVKSVLMDQRRIAGLGNIYADEILFAAGVYPGAKANHLKEGVTKSIHTAMNRILKQAIKAGGSTIRDYADAYGKQGSYQNRHQVYGRAGKPCPKCQTPIVVDRKLVSGRSTHFCPTCQTIGRPKSRTRPHPSPP